MLKKIHLLYILLLTSCYSNNIEPTISNQISYNNNILKEYTDVEIIDQIKNNILSYNDYLIETIGKTKASKNLINYTQKTNTIFCMIDGNYYNNIMSTSTLINHLHTVFIKDDVVSYLDSDNDGLKKVDKETYIDIYGKLPSNETIFNYIINENTINYCNRAFVNDNYEISIDLNVDLSVENMLKQMVVFGKLNKNPIFSSINIKIQFDKNFKLLSFESNDHYTIDKNIIGEMKCHQHLKSTVYYENYEKPNLEKFN